MDQNEVAEYAEAYAFDTTLKVNDVFTVKASPTKLYRAIALNLDCDFRAFEAVWWKKCPRCVGFGGKEDCSNCNDTGYITPYDLALSFVRIPGKRWKCAIYTDKPGVDCWEIARMFGGDGDARAAQFQCKDLPFEI